MSTCFICQRDLNDSVFLKQGIRFGPDIEVRRCSGCGLVHLWPLASSDELDRYYSGEYREEYQEPRVEERFISDLGEARERVQRLLPMLGQEDRILEIGSGSGAFLESIRPYVMVTEGVEPDQPSCQWIQDTLGLKAYSHLDMVSAERGRYDWIFMYHVLEHLRDPVAFLKQLTPLLKPGGRLLVEVPNVEDALVSLYAVPAYLDFYYQKVHLYYFSTRTLTDTLERAGFKATIQGVQRYDLSNHIQWMRTGAPGGQAFFDKVFSHVLNAAYAESLILGGLSDTIMAITAPTE
ncbi:MAG: class I SAM-dependent methyltransferase [Solirubrobacterales bacterium]